MKAIRLLPIIILAVSCSMEAIDPVDTGQELYFTEAGDLDTAEDPEGIAGRIYFEWPEDAKVNVWAREGWEIKESGLPFEIVPETSLGPQALFRGKLGHYDSPSLAAIYPFGQEYGDDPSMVNVSLSKEIEPVTIATDAVSVLCGYALYPREGESYSFSMASPYALVRLQTVVSEDSYAEEAIESIEIHSSLPLRGDVALNVLQGNATSLECGLINTFTINCGGSIKVGDMRRLWFEVLPHGIDDGLEIWATMQLCSDKKIDFDRVKVHKDIVAGKYYSLTMDTGDVPIRFEDENVEACMVKNFDKNGDGLLTIKEAGKVSALLKVHIGAYAPLIKTFRELKYFSNLEVIGQECFQDAWLLEEISIPPSVIEIGTRAFERCYSLKSITLPELKTLGSTTFSYCPNLTEINFPEKWEVEKIPNCMLQYTAVRKVVIPEGTIEFGDYILRGVLYENSLLNNATNISDAMATYGLSESVAKLRCCWGAAGTTSRDDKSLFIEGSELVLPASLRYIGTQVIATMNFQTIRFRAQVPPEYKSTSAPSATISKTLDYFKGDKRWTPAKHNMYLPAGCKDAYVDAFFTTPAVTISSGSLNILEWNPQN